MPYIGNSPEHITTGQKVVYKYIATAGQTVFTGTDASSNPLTITSKDTIDVFYNGVRLINVDDYTRTTDQVTLVATSTVGDEIIIISIASFQDADHYTKLEVDGVVNTSISDLIDTAPATLNTLNELAAAIGDDPSHVATMTTLIDTKLSLAGGTLTGNLTLTKASGSATTRFQGASNSDASKLFISHVSAGDGGLRYNPNNEMDIFSYSDVRFNVGTANVSGSIGNQRMVIKNNGNVGIGTNSPTSHLHLWKNGGTSIVCDSNQSKFEFQSANQEAYINMTGTGNITFRMGSGYATKLTLDSNGTVTANAFVGDGSGLTGIASTLDSLTDCTISAAIPTINTNPSAVGHLWIEEDTGDIYICTDATTGANYWKNQSGGMDVNPSTVSTFDIFGDGSARTLYQLDGNANDTGGSYNATIVGSVNWDTGKFGLCYSNNGSNKYILAPRIFDTNFSWSVWVKFNSTNGSRFFGVESGGISNDVVFQSNGGHIQAYVDPVGTVTIKTNFSTGVWYHIVAVKGVGFYLDGSLAVSIPSMVQPGSGGYMGIGVDGADYGEVGYLDGKLDQIRMFNKVLSAAEVLTLYNES